MAAQISETVEIKRPSEVWRVIGQPERWFEGYLETRTRSERYAAPETRNDHLYRTRIKEEVRCGFTRSEASALLEETQQGKTVARRVRYSLSPVPDGTSLRVEDNVVFKGLGKLTGGLPKVHAPAPRGSHQPEARAVPAGKRASAARAPAWSPRVGCQGSALG